MPTNENNFGDLTPRQDFDVATGDTKRTLLAERNKEFHKPSLLERDGTRFRSTSSRAASSTSRKQKIQRRIDFIYSSGLKKSRHFGISAMYNLPKRRSNLKIDFNFQSKIRTETIV